MVEYIVALSENGLITAIVISLGLSACAARVSSENRCPKDRFKFCKDEAQSVAASVPAHIQEDIGIIMFEMYNNLDENFFYHINKRGEQCPLPASTQTNGNVK